MMVKIRENFSNDRGLTLLVVLLVMAILLSVIGAGLLFSGINTKRTANYNLGTKAFYAGNTGLSVGVGQLGPDPATATTAFTWTLGNGLAVRSGHRTDSAPQPFQFKGTVTEPGFSLNVGTGYNASGYVFNQYQINATGTYNTLWGLEVAGREVEAQAKYGPISR